MSMIDAMSTINTMPTIDAMSAIDGLSTIDALQYLARCLAMIRAIAFSDLFFVAQHVWHARGRLVDGPSNSGCQDESTHRTHHEGPYHLFLEIAPCVLVNSLLGDDELASLSIHRKALLKRHVFNDCMRSVLLAPGTSFRLEMYRAQS